MNLNLTTLNTLQTSIFTELYVKGYPNHLPVQEIENLQIQLPSQSDESSSSEEVISNKGESTSSKLKKLYEESKKKFNEIKELYPDQFNFQGIKKIEEKKTYKLCEEVKQNKVKVSDSALFTKNVGTGLCILARGKDKNNKIWLGLLNNCGGSGEKESLNEIKNKLTKKGCLGDSIQFCLVGGQLPYRDKRGEISAEYSVETQKTYLSFSKKFNIIGAQFNVIEGRKSSLQVLLTEDEISCGKIKFENQESELEETSSGSEYTISSADSEEIKLNTNNGSKIDEFESSDNETLTTSNKRKLDVLNSTNNPNENSKENVTKKRKLDNSTAKNINDQITNITTLKEFILNQGLKNSQ